MLDECRLNIVRRQNTRKTETMMQILGNEIPGLEKQAGFRHNPLSDLKISLFTDETRKQMSSWLDSLSFVFSGRLNNASASHDAIYHKLVNDMGQERVYAFRQEYYNDDLADLVLNSASTDKIIQGRDKLIRKKDPVFMDPVSRVGKSHFYAPLKFIGNLAISTLWFNICALWFMSLILYLTLQYNILRKTIEYFGGIKKANTA